MSCPVVHVAVGVIRDPQGKILLSQRPEHVHQGGRWEFPGGKVEANENIEQALERELREELGIQLHHYRPLIRIPHCYPDKRVLLDVWQVDDFSDEPRGMENQPLQWVEPHSLKGLNLPEANLPIISAVTLPSQYLITGDFSDRDDFLRRLTAALQQGHKLIQYRVSQDNPLWESLARDTIACCREFAARILINSTVETAVELNADGVHLNSSILMQTGEIVKPKDFLLAASVHNKTQLQRANDLGVTFSLLSPVLPTASHPDVKAMGWPWFAELAEIANHPVYALGGMKLEHLDMAWSHGGQGIAAIRSLWDSK